MNKFVIVLLIFGVIFSSCSSGNSQEVPKVDEVVSQEEVEVVENVVDSSAVEDQAETSSDVEETFSEVESEDEDVEIGELI